MSNFQKGNSKKLLSYKKKAFFISPSANERLIPRGGIAEWNSLPRKNISSLVGKKKGSGDNNYRVFSLHLLELRYRAFYLFLSFTGTFLAGTQESISLTHFILTPLSLEKAECSQFIFTQVTEGFYATLELSLICSLCLCAPLMIYQIYSFFIPSCYRGEREKINFIFFFILIFFLLSLFIAYTFVLPKICAFLRQFQYESTSLEIKLQARIGPAIGWSSTTFLLTALFFQAPVFFYAFAPMGGDKKNYLREKSQVRFFFPAVDPFLFLPARYYQSVCSCNYGMPCL